MSAVKAVSSFAVGNDSESSAELGLDGGAEGQIERDAQEASGEGRKKGDSGTAQAFAYLAEFEDSLPSLADEIAEDSLAEQAVVLGREEGRKLSEQLRLVAIYETFGRLVKVARATETQEATKARADEVRKELRAICSGG